jgi:DNA-binding IclR family transcriptional regulator
MRPALLPTEATEVAGSAEVLAVRFGPRPFSAMRRVQRVLTGTPRLPWALASASGFTVSETSRILTKLVKAGLAMKIGAGYARCGPAMPVLEEDAVPMEIGRQVLLCLTEPRRAKEIACIINRPASNATAQLQHLLRQGLVVRVSKGVYDLARPKLVRQARTESAAKPGRQRQAERCQRLTEAGLVQVATWVPDGSRSSILGAARRLRKKAGVLLPSERRASIAAPQAVRDA